MTRECVGAWADPLSPCQRVPPVGALLFQAVFVTAAAGHLTAVPAHRSGTRSELRASCQAAPPAQLPLSSLCHPLAYTEKRYPTFRIVSTISSCSGPSLARIRRIWTSTVRVPP